jgi:hypothetical protein
MLYTYRFINDYYHKKIKSLGRQVAFPIPGCETEVVDGSVDGAECRNSGVVQVNGVGVGGEVNSFTRYRFWNPAQVSQPGIGNATWRPKLLIFLW